MYTFDSLLFFVVVLFCFFNCLVLVEFAVDCVVCTRSILFFGCSDLVVFAVDCVVCRCVSQQFICIWVTCVWTRCGVNERVIRLDWCLCG